MNSNARNLMHADFDAAVCKGNSKNTIAPRRFAIPFIHFGVENKFKLITKFKPAAFVQAER